MMGARPQGLCGPGMFAQMVLEMLPGGSVQQRSTVLRDWFADSSIVGTDLEDSVMLNGEIVRTEIGAILASSATMPVQQ